MRTKKKEIKDIKFKVSWGVSIFVGKEKIKEFHFKTEKDMAYWLYKAENYLTQTKDKGVKKE